MLRSIWEISVPIFRFVRELSIVFFQSIRAFSSIAWSWFNCLSSSRNYSLYFSYFKWICSKKSSFRSFSDCYLASFTFWRFCLIELALSSFLCSYSFFLSSIITKLKLLYVLDALYPIWYYEHSQLSLAKAFMQLYGIN